MAADLQRKFEKKWKADGQLGIFATADLKKGDLIYEWKNAIYHSKKTRLSTQIGENIHILFKDDDFQFYNHSVERPFSDDVVILFIDHITISVVTMNSVLPISSIISIEKDRVQSRTSPLEKNWSHFTRHVNGKWPVHFIANAVPIIALDSLAEQSQFQKKRCMK